MGQSVPIRLLRPILLTALLGVTLLVLATTLWIIHNNGAMIKEYQRREGHLIARGLTNAIAPDLVHKDYGSLEARLLQAASDPDVHSVLVADMQGHVLSYVVGISGSIPAHPDFDLRQVELPKPSSRQVEEEHPGFLRVWHIVNIGRNVGWVRLDMGSSYFAVSMEKMRHEMWALALAIAVIGGILLGTAILRSHRLMSLREMEMARTHRQLEDKAYYDSLTHLPNRTLLLDRLSLAIARNARTRHLLAVCFVDLDNFKPVNDNFGHAIGDQVLIEVARRLDTSVRGGDTVARLGGDEFIVLLGELETEEEAGQAVERLLLSLRKPLQADGKKVEIQASIGYVLYPNDCSDEESLIELADEAMYRVKDEGGGSIRRHRSASI